MTANNKIKAYCFLTFSMCAWGTLYVVSKYVLRFVTPLAIIFFRYFLASIILSAILIKKKPQHIEKGDWKYIALFGALGYFLSTILQLYSTDLMNSGLSSLLNSMNPIFTVVLAIPFLHEKLTFSKGISVIIAIVGVYIVIGGVNGGGEILGVVLAISAVIAWTLASFVIKKHLQKYDTLTVTTYSIIFGFLLTIPFSAFDFSRHNNANLLKPSVILGILFIGIVCTAITNILWNKSLTLIDAGQCSIFCPLQPPISALLGYIFLHEKINASFAIGALLILASIVLCVISDNIKSDHLNFGKHSLSASKLQ